MSGTLLSRATNLSRIVCAAVLACGVGTVTHGWSLSGTVKDSKGAGLSGVSVTVKDSASYKATSGNDGSFAIASITSGVSERPGHATSLRVVEGTLVVGGMPDGALELAIVDATGRTLWNGSAASTNGEARCALPNRIGRNALFLRIRHARGVEFHAVAATSEGLAFTQPAERAMASFPVLVFKKAGYRDTTFTMTAASQTGVVVTMSDTAAATTCSLPSTFKWKDNGAPVAGPKNGWTSIKDFTHVSYNGKHYVYMTYYLNGWNAAQMAPFTNWSEAANATQTKTNTGVAPELMYFTPKKTWIMSKQWCSGGSFCWMESNDVGNGSSFQLKGNLLTELITDDKKAPIDQTLICDDSKCYIFYADDNGRIYRGSMAKSSFPGTFSGTTKILQDTQARLFEAVQVYKIKGQKLYLMIVECMSPRYFRAFTATDLGGTWTQLAGATTQAQPFAGKNNVTGGWSDDISHGDIVRSTHDEYREIDPCNLQLIYQGFKSPYSGDYGKIPYQMGLLTLVR